MPSSKDTQAVVYSFGANANDTSNARKLAAGGDGESTLLNVGDSGGFGSGMPVAKSGRITELAVAHQGDLSVNNATVEVFANGVSAGILTLSSAGGSGTAGVETTSLSHSVSTGDVITVEINPSGTAPDETLATVIVETP